jgi:signal peptidase II
MKKYFIIAITLIIIDQITKYIVKNYFTYSTNTGAIFGILQNQTKLIILLTFLAVGFLTYYTTKIKSPYGFGFVFAGLIGNLIDRLTYSYVIDYIKILTWPAFNLADIFLVTGVIILIIHLRNKL